MTRPKLAGTVHSHIECMGDSPVIRQEYLVHSLRRHVPKIKSLGSVIHKNHVLNLIEQSNDTLLKKRWSMKYRNNCDDVSRRQ